MKHRHLYFMLLGLAEIANGIVRILSLGHAYPDYDIRIVFWDAELVMKRKGIL